MFKFNSTALLIIFLVFLLFIIAVIQVILSPHPGNFEEIGRDIVNSNTNNSTNLKRTALSVTRVDGAEKDLSVTSDIVVYFSEPVSFSGLKISLQPQREVEYNFDLSGRILTITPKDNWVFGTSYSLIIEKDTIGVSGAKLNEAVVINFSTAAYGGI